MSLASSAKPSLLSRPDDGCKSALEAAGIRPLTARPKEGLALLNGTQVSTAMALVALYRAQRTLQAALVVVAMSVDAAKGSVIRRSTHVSMPFAIIRVRSPVPRVFRDLLQGSQIRVSHRDCSRVQDPYSLRCPPQVMGACWDALHHAGLVLLREANAVSDNPLVFSEGDALFVWGEFPCGAGCFGRGPFGHRDRGNGSPVGTPYRIIDRSSFERTPSVSGARWRLELWVHDSQVTAAALASENKHLASSVSVDSLPTSANQERHVSMATYAARRLMPMIDNTNTILAIELLAASQGIDFRRPLLTSPPLNRSISR